jgi:hypothetical protein
LELVPFGLDKIKIFKDDLLDLTFTAAIHIIAIGLFYVKIQTVEPELALHIAFLAMNMYRLMTFVGIKEKSPPHNE